MDDDDADKIRRAVADGVREGEEPEPFGVDRLRRDHAAAPDPLWLRKQRRNMPTEGGDDDAALTSWTDTWRPSAGQRPPSGGRGIRAHGPARRRSAMARCATTTSRSRPVSASPTRATSASCWRRCARRRRRSSCGRSYSRRSRATARRLIGVDAVDTGPRRAWPVLGARWRLAAPSCSRSSPSTWTSWPPRESRRRCRRARGWRSRWRRWQPPTASGGRSRDWWGQLVRLAGDGATLARHAAAEPGRRGWRTRTSTRRPRARRACSRRWRRRRRDG